MDMVTQTNNMLKGMTGAHRLLMSNLDREPVCREVQLLKAHAHRAVMERRQRQARRVAVLIARQHAEDCRRIGRAISPEMVEAIVEQALDGYERHMRPEDFA